jgi:hypothetical protein
VLLSVTFVLAGIVAVAAVRMLAPPDLRREIAELIAPDLEAPPRSGDPAGTPPRSGAGSRVERAGPPVERQPAARPPARAAPAFVPPPTAAAPPSAAAPRPDPPRPEGSPTLAEPPGRIVALIEAPDRVVAAPGPDGIGIETPAGSADGAASPPPPTSAAPRRPPAEASPAAAPGWTDAGDRGGASIAPRAAATRAAVQFPAGLSGTPSSAPVALSRAGFEDAEPVPGALGPGEARVRFPHLEDPERSMARWYPPEPSRPAAIRTLASAPARATPATRGVAPGRAATAATPRRASRAPVAPRVEAQVRRGQLEQDVESMLKSRLRQLRR